MRVLVEPRPGLPLVRLSLVLRSGAAEDPVEHEGLASFAAELARRGAGGLGRARLDRRLDELGAEVGVAVGPEATAIDADAPAAAAEQVLALLADMLLRPRLAPREAARLRQEMAAWVDELAEDDPALARRAFLRALYRDGPGGRPLLGTRASIATLTSTMARAWLEERVARGNLLLGAAGEVEERAVARQARRLLGGRPSPPRPRSLVVAPPRSPRHRLVLVDKPGRAQAQIMIGQAGPPWPHPDHLPLTLAVTAFGGTFTSPLVRAVRVDRGLSYGVSARLGQGRGSRPVVVHAFPDRARAGETLALLLDLWREWTTRGPRAEDVRFARRHLVSAAAFDRATAEDRLDLRLAADLAGLPEEQALGVAERLGGVDHAAVRAAVRRQLSPTGLTIVVLGTVARVARQIEALGLDAETEVWSHEQV